MSHGFEKCAYCRDIISILVFKEAFEGTSEGIRFNDLVELARKAMNPKISHMTLLRHLEPLEKLRIVKRQKKGRQAVFYSLSSNSPILKKEDLAFQKTLSEFYDKTFNSVRLETILQKLLALSRLNDLYQFKLQLEATYGKRTQQQAYLISRLDRCFLTYYSSKLMDALAGKELQYPSVRDDLETKIAEEQKQIVNWLKGLIDPEKRRL